MSEIDWKLKVLTYQVAVGYDRPTYTAAFCAGHAPLAGAGAYASGDPRPGEQCIACANPGWKSTDGAPERPAKRGRPPGRADTVAFPARLPPVLAADLNSLSESTGESMNSITVRALEALLKRERKKARE